VVADEVGECVVSVFLCGVGLASVGIASAERLHQFLAVTERIGLGGVGVSCCGYFSWGACGGCEAAAGNCGSDVGDIG